MVFSIFITKYIVANFVSLNGEFYSTPKWDGIGSLVSPYQKQDFLVKMHRPEDVEGLNAVDSEWPVS